MQKICIIITKDKKSYKLGLDLLKRYSTFFNVMLEDQVVEELELSHISSAAFDYVYEFFQLHKVSAPKQISKPVLRKVNLSTVMSEQDAELMQRINGLQTEFKIEIMNTAMYLQMDSFKKYLTYTIMQKELEQQGAMIQTSEEFESQIKNEIQSRINNLIQMENHRKRLAQGNFEESIEFS